MTDRTFHKDVAEFQASQGSKEMLLKQETNAKVSQYQFYNTVMSN